MIDPEHEQIAMLETARAEREEGDHSAAVRSFEAAASLAGELGDEATECLALDELAVTLRNLSDSGAKRGDAEAMQRHALDLLALARRRGDVVAEAEAMNRCGVADLRNGQVDAARRRFEQALDIYRTAGSAAGEERYQRTSVSRSVATAIPRKRSSASRQL